MTELQFMSVLFFIVGTVVGSFLNVCIVRLPKNESIVYPGSHCPSCKHPIAWYQNVPIFSYVLLLGRCPYCRSGISFRYLVVEVLTGAAFAGFYAYSGFTLLTFAYLVMTCCFIIATFVDFAHRIIPDEISIGGMVAGVALSLFVPGLHDISDQTLTLGRAIMYGIISLGILFHLGEKYLWKRPVPDLPEDEHDGDPGVLNMILICMLVTEVLLGFVLPLVVDLDSLAFGRNLKSLDAAIIGAYVGGGVIYVMGMLGDYLFRKDSMGGGDIKLMGLVGAFMGWGYAVIAFFVAPFFGALYGVVEKIRTKDSAIAYGPFLVIGALITLFYGRHIWQFLQGNYTFNF